MTEKHVKGTHLVNVFKFVKWKRGILGVHKFLEEVHKEPDLKKVNENTYVERDWYDYDLYMRLLRIADKTVGMGDLSKIYEIGMWTVQNLGHLSYLAKSPDIREFMKSATNNWQAVYDFGKVEVIVDEEKRIVVRYSGFPTVPEKCQYFRGSLTGMMNICNLKGAVKATACNTQGADYCEFELTWE